MKNLFSFVVTLSLAVFAYNGMVFGHLEEESGELSTRADPILTSNITQLTPQYFTDLGSKRVEITYGPFTAPPSTTNNGMQDYQLRNATTPCSDCTITWMQAGLIYPNGTYANADTGMWLHHTVLTNTGRVSATCGTQYGGDRFFASGNERTPVSICANGTDQVGYYLGANDNVAFLVELMNETPDPRPVVVTITYEYILGLPSSFTQVTPIWLDVSNNCTGDSEVPAFNNTAFNYTMQPRWKADFDGKVTCIVGHLHDGGTHLQVLKSGNPVCDCVAAYGQTPGYVESGSMSMNMSMNMDSMDMVHISSLESCLNPTTSSIGDEWGARAFYNTREHAPMLNMDGSLAGVMGISLVYISQGTNITTGSNVTTIATSSVSTSGTATATSSAASGTTTNAASEMVASVGVLLAGVGVAFLM